ncbi:MAG: hypothetical protein ACRC35_02230 [Angustibacter sp.]
MASSGTVSIHYQALRDFADALEKKLGQLDVAGKKVAALADEKVRLGDFIEAHLLVSRHEAAVLELKKLLATIDDVIRHSTVATRKVAQVFRDADQYHAQQLHSTTGQWST